VRVGAATLGRGRRIAFPLESFTGVVYNATSPRFADAATRRAMGLLLDREAIRCSVLRCLAEIIDGPWPRAAGGRARPVAAGMYDPPAARRLLDAAGWRDGDGDGVRERAGERLSFLMLVPDTDRGARRWVALYGADLAAAGVELRLAAVGWGVYTDRLRAKRFDAAVVSASNAEPFDAGALFHSRAAESGRNFGGFADPRVDAALDALAAAADPAEGAALRERLAAILGELEPITFAFAPGEEILVRASVRGIRIRDEWLDERSLWLDRPGGGAP
jgi:peptide/nickel transport system substrate-binding protein